MIVRFRIAWMASLLALCGLAGTAPAGAQSGPGAQPPLRVAVYMVAPYANIGEAGAIDGHSVRLWSMVAAELRTPFELIPIDSVDRILAGLRNGEADLAIGALTVTPAREELVDFSNPTHPSGVAAAIRRPGAFTSATQALGSTMAELLPLFLLVAGLIVVAGFISWRLERPRAPAPDAPGTTIASFGEGVYWAAVTMTTVGYGDKAPRSGSARVLTVIWMFIGIIVISIFSGTVTAKLTATQFITLEGSEHALRLPRLGAVTSSSGAEFLTMSNRNFQGYETLDTALAALEAGETDAVFNSRGALVHHVTRRGGHMIEVLSTDLTRGWMAFAVPPGSVIKESLNRALLRVMISRAWIAERDAMAREYSAGGRADRTTF